MSWSEELPRSCPPDDALTSSGVSYYRVLCANEISENDFKSHRLLYPNKKFPVSECQARSISIFPSIEDCAIIFKLPKYKNKAKIIGEISIDNEDGVIKNTPSNTSLNHFSWWRSREFDINKVKIVQYGNQD